jgi:signal transduction histidine kinase
MENLLKFFDFESLIVVDISHKILYQSSEEVLSENFKRKIDSLIHSSDQHFQLLDASPDDPDKQPLLFYFIPVKENNQSIGYVLVRENMGKIQDILYDTTGMGSTGESYLVGTDYLMRSKSRFFPDRAPLSIQVKTDAVVSAFKQEPGEHIIDDYRNIKVLSAFGELSTDELPWAIVSEIDYAEALTPIIRLRYYLIGVTVLLLIFILVVTYFVSSAIAKPIVSLRDIINSLAKGIIPKVNKMESSTSEIAEITRSILKLTDGLQRTTSFAYEIGAGNFQSEFTSLSDEDTLGKSLLHMRDELRSLHERQVRLVRERAAALLEGQEKERKRIIQDLHDGVGQLLIAVKMRIAMVEANDELKVELNTRINELIAEVRRIAYNVMPNAIVDYGLEAALNGLCENVKRYTSLQIEFTYVREDEQELSFEVSIAIFRIVQEGLNNIVKHAAATIVKLNVIHKEDELYFSLEDNGKGMDESKPNIGFGLQSMKERANLLNGSFQIYSPPGEGTSLEVNVPLN